MTAQASGRIIRTGRAPIGERNDFETTVAVMNVGMTNERGIEMGQPSSTSRSIRQ
jgi:hypothetical protein